MGVVLVALLVPWEGFACLWEEPSSWSKQTADGRFELSLKVSGEHGWGPGTFTLRDLRTGKQLWEHTLERHVYEGRALMSSKGPHVAVVSTYSEEVRLYGANGGVQRVSLEAHVTPAEKRQLSRTSCGSRWVGERSFEGDVLTLQLLTDGWDPEESRPGTPVRIDARTGQLSRPAPAPERSTPELIQAYWSHSDPGRRWRIVVELFGRSEEGKPGGDADLRRFWLELIREPRTPQQVFIRAAHGLGVIGTDEEWRTLMDLPVTEFRRSIVLLEVLRRRLPEEAQAYAERVRKVRDAEEARERAVELEEDVEP